MPIFHFSVQAIIQIVQEIGSPGKALTMLGPVHTSNYTVPQLTPKGDFFYGLEISLWLKVNPIMLGLLGPLELQQQVRNQKMKGPYRDTFISNCEAHYLCRIG